MTLVCAAIPAFAIIAQAAPESGFGELLNHGGGLGVLAGLAGYLLTKTIPAMHQAFAEEMKQQREAHVQQVREMQAAHTEQLHDLLLTRDARDK